VRLIARRSLIAFATAHPETEVSLRRWWLMIEAARWTGMNDVAAAASKAKVLNGERARFEVMGGDDRLIAAFDFQRQIVFVKFIGTHAAYDRVDALNVSMF
jgi:mRNA interferase HigB